MCPSYVLMCVRCVWDVAEAAGMIGAALAIVAFAVLIGFVARNGCPDVLAAVSLTPQHTPHLHRVLTTIPCHARAGVYTSMRLCRCKPGVVAVSRVWTNSLGTALPL